MNAWVFVVLLGPLAGAALAAAGSRWLRAATHWVVLAGVGAAAAASLVIFQSVVSSVSTGAAVTTKIVLFDWIPIGASSWISAELLVDPLTAIMLLVVTSISFLVVVYSRDYMRHHGRAEPGYERFFASLSLFVFAMCVLVLGGNFVLLYLGWEAVGLCSYLLIGFYYSKPEAAAAAKKAFLVNRVGDFGFALGILLIYLTFDTLEYKAVFDMVAAGVSADGSLLAEGRLTLIALLLLCGACGKSAQLPLHVWLPDAMEGPTPVSALIHAATMVTAGVYMIARCGAIFAASPTAMVVVASLGAVTAFFAATIALVQTDMKRILAYSTISQLGFMFLGIGVYAADSAIFHLFTHAFFKALLFLGAGSVMHAMNGVIDVRRFGGLRSMLPWTYRTFLVGGLALAGFPLLSGFFSKDEILHHAITRQPLLGVLGLATALLTAFYTFRMIFRAFWGPLRLPEGVKAHESGGWMLAPLFVLSIGAVFAGFVGAEGSGGFHRFLAPVFKDTFVEPAKQSPHLENQAEASAHGNTGAPKTSGEASQSAGFWSHYGLLLLSAMIAFLGIGASYVIYVKQPWIAAVAAASAPGAYDALINKYYIDELYTALIVSPLRKLGRIVVALDNYLIDGLIWVVTAIPRGGALVLRGSQSGLLQGYALSMVFGAAIIAILIVWI